MKQTGGAVWSTPFFYNLTVAERSAEWQGEFLSPVLDIAMCVPKSGREAGAVQEPEEIAPIGLVWEPFFLRTLAARCADKAASAKYQL